MVARDRAAKGRRLVEFASWVDGTGEAAAQGALGARVLALQAGVAEAHALRG